MALLALALLLAATPCAARRGVNYDMTIDETDPVRKSRLKAHVRRIRAAVNLGAELTWFATGARTSPSTSEELESTALAPNHVVRKLIAALLEEHRG